MRSGYRTSNRLKYLPSVITGFGLPMGPFAMAHLAGLDIGWRVRKARGRPKDERV